MTAATLQRRRADALAAVSCSPIYTGGESNSILYGNAAGRVRWLVTSLGIAAIDLCATEPQGDAIAPDILLRVRVTVLGDLSFTRYSTTLGPLLWRMLAPLLACVAAIGGITEDPATCPLFPGQDVSGPSGLCRVVSVLGSGRYVVRPYGEDATEERTRGELAPC